MIRPPLNVEAASRLAPKIHLDEVSFMEVTAKYETLPTQDVPTLNWDLADPTAHWEIIDRDLRVLLPLALDINFEREEKKERLAKIVVALAIDYHLKKGESWDEDDVPHYVGISGFIHAWPYFRAEVQALTTKLRLPPLTLPVIVSGHAAKKVSVVRAGEQSEGRKALPKKAKRAKPKAVSRASKRSR